MCRVSLSSGHITVSLVLFLLLSSCSPTRPVRKIGLLAPFEGLHRESGYNALSAMRSAINDYPLAGVEILPLALDTSASPPQARRAAHKLLRDSSVLAVIGPLQLSEVSAVAEIMTDRNLDWQQPLNPGTHESVLAYIEAMITEIAGQNIVLVGVEAPWSQVSPSQWSAATGKTVTVAADVSEAARADGVLWLGDARDGAAFLGLLRERNHRVPFWTTAIAGDPVFSALAQDKLDGRAPGPVFWAAQLNEDPSQYSGRLDENAQDAPIAFAVYLATRKVLTQLAGQPVPSDDPGLAIFSVDNEGMSQLTQFVPLQHGR